jgi:hypothetical protein
MSKEAIKHDQDDELDTYRRGTNLNMIHGLPKELQEPGYSYRLVTLNSRNMPFNLQHHESLGWEVVYSDARDIDDRDGLAKEKPNVRKSPVFVTKKPGYRAVYMKIKTEVLEARQIKQAKENALRLEQASGIHKRGSGVQVIGEELTCESMKNLKY